MSDKHLVLIGGGHSHVEVLREFGMNPPPGIRLTLISRVVHTPYSGILPGLIAGHYQFEDAHIDLAPLARFAGAELLHDEAVGLDLAARQVICRDNGQVPYHAVSIDIGSAPATNDTPGAAEHTVPVKPISRVLLHWEALRDRLLRSDKPARIAVVGAGAGGVELLLAIQHRLLHDLAARNGDAAHLSFHLVTDESGVLPNHNRRVRAVFRDVLATRNVAVHTDHRVTKVMENAVLCANGETLAFDEILWVTSAGAAGWPAAAGLDTDARGFIAVGDTLQSTSHNDVFASGDIAAMVNHPRPKAGVFAVRQGPPLAANLRRYLHGEPLQPYIPQRDFLSLISTGDRYAVASRGPWTLKGRLMWYLKDRIDRRFMRRYKGLSRLP